MSLGICLKGPEGIVLAADSRVTLFHPISAQNLYVPATYDNATKLLSLSSQPFVGMVTYGLGAIGQTDFRTPYSLLPELDNELPQPRKRMIISDFAKSVSGFFMKQWASKMPKVYTGDAIRFIVAGYDQGELYGKVFWFSVPYKPDPIEYYPNSFGILYDGQCDFVYRLLRGYDENLIPQIKEVLSLTDDNVAKLMADLSSKSQVSLPLQFLPLQDCVDLAMFLIRTTISMQTFLPTIRGVGGPVDVATIVRTEGFKALQQKSVRAAKPTLSFEGLLP
ncbi:MAG: hypothetical protein ABR954_00635 [Dehalococcoidales bacterium]